MSHQRLLSRIDFLYKNLSRGALFFLLLPISPVAAAPTTLEEAARALSEGLWEKARSAYSGQEIKSEEDARRALVAGRAAFAAKDFEEAASLLLAVAEAKSAPETVSYAGEMALFYAAESFFRASDRETARDLFTRFLTEYPSSDFALRARARLADCALALGEDDAALEAYQDLLGKKANFLDDSQIRFNIARIRQKKGEVEKAQADFLKLVLSSPATPAGRASWEILETISPGFAEKLSPEEKLTRYENLFSAREYDEACPEAKKLAEEKDPSSRALYLAARCYYYERDRIRAGELFYRSAPKDPDRVWRAITSYTSASGEDRTEGYKQARALIEKFLKQFPRASQVAKAKYKAAWLDYDEENYKEAVKAFDAYLKRYPKDDDARWYAAWSRYLDGDQKGALPYLEALSKDKDPLIGGKGRYWRARILQSLGDKKTARALYLDIIKTWPFTYYARLSRERLKKMGVKVSPFGEPSKGKPKAAAIHEGKLSKELEALARKEPALDKTRFFLELGLLEEAKEALRAKESFLRKKYGKDAIPLLCPLYVSVGDFHRAFFLAEVSYQKELDQKPEGFARLAWAWAYPRAYPRETRDLAKQFSVDANLLWALMRKESGFDPWAVSYADALGLMQLLPKTGEQVASSLQEDRYMVGDLFRPEANIRLAGFYVKKLMERFGGQTLLAAAAYNGGPSAVGRWLDEFGSRPLDEFVEEITYAQSREYLKKIAGSYARYRYLYDGKDDPMPLTVNVKNDPTVVDY